MSHTGSFWRNTILLLALVGLGVGLGRAWGMGSSESETVAPGAEPRAVATFAGGCFWCMEPPFEKLDGVVDVTAGYSGGDEPTPTYEQVSSGSTGHAEAVQVRFDPARIGYEELLAVFWRQIDPTDPAGQFVDRGRQYRGAIFWHDEEQRRVAERSRAALADSGRFSKPIVTEIVPFRAFTPAEDYHQDYHEKNPLRYRFYRRRSGRDSYLRKVWSQDVKQESRTFRKPSDEELHQRLSPLQFEVTQHDATEPAFQNEYWNHKGEGLYVDVVSGEPLFSSREKFDSGTGWPSFTRPVAPEHVVEREDRSLWAARTEVRSRDADSHLGHVFPDGPPPTGLRYCINSAALRFVPERDLEREGYRGYRSLFEE